MTATTKPKLTTVDGTEPVPTIGDTTGDTKETAERELEPFNNKTEEVKLSEDDPTLDATQGQTGDK